MSSRDDVEVARELYAGFAARDMAAVGALLHPEVRVEQAGGLPWSGTYTGPTGVQAFLGALLAHVDSRVEIGELFAVGDAVVQVGRTRGTARATGRSFDAAEVHVLRVRGGSIASFEAFVDEAEFARALS
ncbi:nuclear transport factor 2 family protein [Actinomycetospora termitidis]|uniref:Nuclear transport factor 2 family protein n=1 Tax=Actinomycetospora termitidis TaxID=3053470 RepID=A0ABT7MA25_9PSEU|nr:nuclear transport factor 2 family protein [Actinomycetospora sp. Odt1-22]MDL5157509.1 nuclear transport factor 2 family protein [Actinomycetospora sp. Odt1-22]